jgi:16S rRNA (guanine527-N7)-methyltransferase
MDAERFREDLRAAAAGCGRTLTPVEADLMTAHYRLLVQWGGKMNLTGLRGRRAIIERHFLEPIAAADLIDGAGLLVDIGSGNGFPAVPLRVIHPGLDLALVEASTRKSAFLRAVIRELGLVGSRVETRRVEGRKDIADLLPCRYLTLRAIASDRLFAGGGPPLLAPGGKALFFVSTAEADRLESAPPPGLRPAGRRALPTGPASVVAVFGPA